MTQPRWSGTPLRSASTVIENPSLATWFLLAVSVSSHRTYKLPLPDVIRMAVMSPEPPPASTPLSGYDGVVRMAFQSPKLPLMQIRLPPHVIKPTTTPFVRVSVLVAFSEHA